MTDLYEDDYPEGIEPTPFPIDAPLTFGEKCVSVAMAFLIVGSIWFGLQLLADKYGWTL